MRQQQRVKGIVWLVWFSRILLGGVFLFSGFVKAVDPLGTAYKIDDYFIAMGLSQLMEFSLLLSIIMVVSEFTLGILLLLGVWRKKTLWLLALFLLFFTPLTFWIALTNPVEDCGCFGDAIKIGNWETFWKNLVLLFCLGILFVRQKDIVSLFGNRMTPFVSLFVLLFAVLFVLFNLFRLPLLDFRPYRIGASISDQMKVAPENADVYETVFIYRKEGIEKEFTEENYPWDDSTWEFVDMQTKLVKEGVKPEIEDFSIELVQTNSISSDFVKSDITDGVLSNPHFTFFMVAYSLEDMKTKRLNRFKEIAEYAQSRDIPFYCLTSSTYEQIVKWKNEYDASFIFGHVDERVLKTMIRANPGLMLLHRGTVCYKWGDRHVPQPIEIDSIIGGSSKKPISNMLKVMIVALILIIPLIVLKVIDNKFIK